MPQASTSAAIGQVFAPGEYLRKRREAAGLTLGEVARQLAAMQFGFIQLDRANLLAHLEKVEASDAGLTLAQAQVLRNIFAFDVGIYDQLLDRHLADELTRRTMPMPQICRGCACSFFDPCLPDPSRGEQDRSSSSAAVGQDGPCHWAENHLCSACAAQPGNVIVDAIPATAHEGAC